MSMTMHGARVNNEMSLNKLNNRYVNLLNLIYLKAQPTEDGGYLIPDNLFEKVQTELDFNPPDEATKKQLEAETKRRYRQRQTYRFWKDALDLANISNEVDALKFLFKIFNKLDVGYYGSMTQSRYALETLHLAIDDTYGTNKTIIPQHSQQPPKKKGKKSTKKKQSKVNASSQNNTQATPF